jgi:hypothetical protein
MQRHLTASLAILGPMAVLALPASSPADAVGRCYEEWSEAAPIVARERLRTARDVRHMARSTLGSDVVRIVLCDENGAYVYRLVLRRLDGSLGTMKVGAGQSSPK